MKRVFVAGLAVIALAAAATVEARSSGIQGYLEARVEKLLTPGAVTKPFAAGATHTLCFVPDGPRCEAMLVGAIDKVKRGQRLWIQAYEFTNQAIGDAVVSAKQRGVDVHVIVDEGQRKSKYTVVPQLLKAGIEVVVDTKPAIAHNKVMIFGDYGVFTGSFNFSASAERRNAENGMLVSGDSEVVQAYTNNWVLRYKQSVAF